MQLKLMGLDYNETQASDVKPAGRINKFSLIFFKKILGFVNKVLLLKQFEVYNKEHDQCLALI